MKTLYVSDLDGTLLRSNQKTSEFTNSIINNLVNKGMIFSYATARSLVTAKKVTSGINAKIPLIVYNGAFVIDNVTEEILIANYFDVSVRCVLDELFANQIFPIVYAYIDGVEKFSFVPELCTDGVMKFLDSRKGDIRTNIVNKSEDLKKGDIFYITCIDEEGKLKTFYDKYKDRFHCVFQKDIYTGDQWLEIMPITASKSNAIRQLQKLLNCEKVISFGDGKNDIDMFKISNASYAVQNADEELKKYATAVISSNDEDGVACWLEMNFLRRKIMKINKDQWKWTRAPKTFVIEDDKIEIITDPHTDLWQRTYYHFRNDNAPVLQIKTDEKYFSFTVKTEFESKVRFDQCGVVMYLDSDNWLKGSIEYENEEFQHLGSVATNNGFSDWATTEIDAGVKSMWYRFSRREDDYCIECSEDGVKYKQMRICHMYKAKDEIWFGIYACSPEKSSFKATFTNMMITECRWQAHDGQVPDEEI